ncbi:MAG: hypothetical protein RIQ46_2133, partial [Pseudomonadota bacterium]
LEHMVAVAVAQAGTFQLSVQVGNRFPALISATGRVLAAFGNYPESELAARFAKLRWESPPAFADWLEQVEQTRRRGIGVDDGNYISGVTVLAAPVWKGGGRPSHALVAIGVGTALKGRQAELEPALIAAARSLTEQLGGGS